QTASITSPSEEATGSWADLLIGEWSRNPSSWDVVDAVTGVSVRPGYSGEWFTFRADGTFRNIVLGSGQFISGVAIVNGKYRVEADQLILYERLESWRPDPTHPGQKPAFDNNPVADETYGISFGDEGQLILANQYGGTDTFYPRP
ncbi:MAG TPA: hypothetical protein VD902_22250, partial [Symbiobacteriaceae bacterium]|nr:hypothetical protein [Symbiobacteriaceae bacterium]